MAIPVILVDCQRLCHICAGTLADSTRSPTQSLIFRGVAQSACLFDAYIVERIVADIDSIVKIVRFDGWQSTTAGKQEVKKALRSVVWIKYKIKDKDVFDKAYNYIEQYY